MEKPIKKPPMKTWTSKAGEGLYLYQSEPYWNNGRWGWDRQAVFIDAKTLIKINKAFIS